MPAKALPGFRDFYPADTALLHHIVAAWRTVSARYGFEEYDGPPLEPLELYTSKSGEEIVGQLYHFEDKGGRAVSLRPEMTPTLARMVAAKSSDFKKPIRWYSIPQLFRYERQQRGRLREHFQLNMDLIGEAGPLADAEVIAAAIDVMRELGFGPDDVRVRISDRRVIRALLLHGGVADDQLAAAYVTIDKVEREDRAKGRARLAAAGFAPEVVEEILRIGEIRGLEAVTDRLRAVPDGRDVGEGLTACHDALQNIGLGNFVDVDLSIVRGLAYYTGIVFELFDAGRSLRAICGGGRYDGLLKALGGVDLPGVGFGMGDVVLGELLRSHERLPERRPSIDVYLVAVTTSDVAEVLSLGHALRDRGVRVEYALKAQAVAKQLKIASARQARRAVLVGPDEREAGEAVVRDLMDGSEERVSLTALRDTFTWA
ncbi:MAG: histidine--tRNA ligase [Gemmatimonadetes bacterium]|nr:histidine--tRNA ligase [Gemmatimonadota bacterium]